MEAISKLQVVLFSVLEASTEAIEATCHLAASFDFRVSVAVASVGIVRVLRYYPSEMYYLLPSHAVSSGDAHSARQFST